MVRVPVYVVEGLTISSSDEYDTNCPLCANTTVLTEPVWLSRTPLIAPVCVSFPKVNKLSLNADAMRRPLGEKSDCTVLTGLGFLIA
jgi:hypothetical protein